MIRKGTAPSLSRAEQLRLKRKPYSRMPVVPEKQKVVPEEKSRTNTFPVRPPAPAPTLRSTVFPVHKTPSTPIHHASVIVTRNLPGAPTMRHSAQGTPRKMVYRTSANGVETRLPAIPAFHFSWQWVSGFMVIALTAVVLLLNILPVFTIHTIEIQGLKRVDPAEVESIVQKSTGSIFTFEPENTVRAIGFAFPELTNISVALSMDGKLTVNAQELQPVLSWTNNGQTIWLDENGIVLPVRGDGGILVNVLSDDSAPLIRSQETPKNIIDYTLLVIHRKLNRIDPKDLIMMVDPEVLKAAIDFNAYMPAGANLIYDSVSGMGWQDPSGWKVYFGSSLDNIQFKQAEYQTIVDYVNSQGEKPAMISVEHIDAPYYRTE